MPTDDERREVAEKLRERTKKPMGKSMQRMFTETLGMYQHNICWMNPDKATARWDTIVNYLADLIEPEERTCHDVSHFGENFRCSECGVAVTVEYDDSALYVGELTDDFSYCPNCGARVVEGE